MVRVWGLGSRVLILVLRSRFAVLHHCLHLVALRVTLSVIQNQATSLVAGRWNGAVKVTLNPKP